jgi:hypothetical protein
MDDDGAEKELIGTLLDPLPKTGHHLGIARRMTAHARASHPQGFATSAREAAARLRDARPASVARGRCQRLAGWLALLIAALFFLLPPALRELRLMIAADSGQLPRGWKRVPGDLLQERTLGRIDPDAGHVLFGDRGQRQLAERWRKQAERVPFAPGIAADFAVSHLRSYRELPPGYLDRARQADPGNGWYDWLEGTALLNHMNRHFSRGQVKDWVRHMENAVAAPRFDDPTAATRRQRLALLPEEVLWADVVANLHHATRSLPRVGENHFDAERQLLPQVLRPTQPWEDFVSWALTVTRLSQRRMENAATPQDLLQAAAGVPSILPSSMPSVTPGRKARLWAALVDLDKTADAATAEFTALPAEVALATAGYGFVPASTSPPDLTRPGIDAEWAMHERLLLWLSLGAFGALIGIMLAVRQSHRGHDLLAMRLSDLLTRRDRLLILLIPLGAPLACYLAATRLPGAGFLGSPLAGEMDPRFVAMALLIAGAAVMVPMLALETARWRMAVRGRALGLGGNGFHLGMIPLILVVCAMVGAAMMPMFSKDWDDLRLPLLASAISIAVAAVWLLVLVAWHFAGPAEGFPARLLQLRLACETMAVAVLLVAGACLALRAHEVRLVSLNRFEKSPRIHHGLANAGQQALLRQWQPRLLAALQRLETELEEPIVER